MGCWQFSDFSPLYPDIDRARQYYQQLVEENGSDLVDYVDDEMGYWDKETLARLRAFVFGSEKEAYSALFWNEITRRPRSAEQISTLLDAVVLDGDITYLNEDQAAEIHDSCRRVESLALAWAESAIEGSDQSTKNACALEKLLTGAWEIGLDFHEGEHPISPFLQIVHDTSVHANASNPSAARDAILELWLSLLSRIGTDLKSYGAEEWRRFQRLRNDEIRGHYSGIWDAYQRSEWRDQLELLAFTYGTEISDWKLYVVHPGDEFGGQFWQMIEEHGLWDGEYDQDDTELASGFTNPYALFAAINEQIEQGTYGLEDPHVPGGWVDESADN